MNILNLPNIFLLFTHPVCLSYNISAFMVENIPTIIAFPDKPFRFRPDLRICNIASTDSYEVVYRPIKLMVPGIGIGEIESYKDLTYRPENFDPLSHPLGPINVEYEKSSRNKGKVTLASAPVSFSFMLYKLNPIQFAKLVVSLTARDKKYQGITRFDDIELEQEETSPLIINEWIPVRGRKGHHLYFPPQPRLIEENLDWIIHQKSA